MKTGNGQTYSGTSGLLIAIPKRDFPPEFQDKSRLAYYALQQNSIEINTSFYKLPLAATVAKWADMVPDDFKFTLKLWKEVTHNKGLLFKEEDVNRFMHIADQAGDKKGSILVQFPPSLTISAAPQLAELLTSINQANDLKWDIAVEFRHKSWYEEDTFDLLREKRAGLVLQDMPASVSPTITTSDEFVYLRFHGPDGMYRGSYGDGILYEYSMYIQEWEQEGKTVYVYFNNTAGDALQNLETLKRYLNHT
jgi:uncharacterized protein YecE (DUF72 family)